MRNGEGGARAAGSRHRRIAPAVACLAGAFSICRPAWSQSTIFGDPTFDVPAGQTQTVSSVIADGATPGSVVKTDAGTLVLTGVNTYTGPTTINGGNLSLVAPGSIATSSGVALTAAGTSFDSSGVTSATAIQGLTGVAGSTVAIGSKNLAIDQTGNSTFAGTVAGTGTLTLMGSADLALTGDSGGFKGSTVVSGGTLDVGTAAAPSAILGGAVTVQNGALVAGHGTVLGSLTNSGGTVVPGGSIGTLTVGGNYAQGSNGTLLVQLNPTAASQLAVAGSASLAGTLALAAAPGQGYVPFSRFTILTTGNGVSGTFSQLAGAFPALPVTVQYQSNTVDLVLGGFAGLKGNETAVANVLNAAFPTATGDFATALDTAVDLPPAQMQQSLSSLGGQIYGNMAQVSLQDRRLFLGAMDDRIRIPGGDSPSAAVLGSLGGGLPGLWGGGGNGVQLAEIANAINDPLADAVNASIAAQTAPANSGNLWARGFGQFGNIDTSEGSLGSNYSTGGGAIGADLIVTPHSLFGVAVSGGQSSVSLNDNPENGTVSFLQVGAYGVQMLSGGLALDGAAIYSHDHYSISRGIILPGASGVATSTHGGNDAVLDVGLSRPTFFGHWQITPRFGVSYFHIDQSAFSESGAGSLDLAVSPNALDALFSRVGVAIAQPMRLGELTLVPEFRAAWLHNFLDDQARFTAGFAGTGAASFGEVGPAVGGDAVDLGVGLSMAIAQTAIPGQMSGFIQYDATLASRETANAVAGGLRYKW